MDRCDVDNHRIKTTVESAVNNPSLLLGEDTDLLILLLFHFELDSNQTIYISNQWDHALQHGKYGVSVRQYQHLDWTHAI